MEIDLEIDKNVEAIENPVKSKAKMILLSTFLLLLLATCLTVTVIVVFKGL